MEFIRETTLVHLKIRCWSGEVKAQKTDITLGQGGSIPPKQLLELGRKKIFPPQALQPLKNLRKAAERACLAVGTRFMGGYAVPDESIESLEKELNDIERGILGVIRGTEIRGVFHTLMAPNAIAHYKSAVFHSWRKK